MNEPDILPGVLIRSRQFPFGGSQMLFASWHMPAVVERTDIGTLYSNELCLVVARRNDRVFVLTEHQQMGWKHVDDFCDV